MCKVVGIIDKVRKRNITRIMSSLKHLLILCCELKPKKYTVVCGLHEENRSTAGVKQSSAFLF